MPIPLARVHSLANAAHRWETRYTRLATAIRQQLALHPQSPPLSELIPAFAEFHDGGAISMTEDVALVTQELSNCRHAKGKRSKSLATRHQPPTSTQSHPPVYLHRSPFTEDILHLSTSLDNEPDGEL